MTVYVCPTRDIECGDNPAHWCHTCPQQHRPEPDCRTCRHCSFRGRAAGICYETALCTNGDHYEPLPPVRLWRTDP